MKTTRLPSGHEIPVLGQGTWRMGESPSQRAAEVAALRYGLDLGLTLIDTAEMYGEGGAELVVGEAIVGRRDEVFLVSKVYPWNATRRGAVAACERSLKRLQTEHLELYLLHWRESVPLEETLDAFQQLKRTGKIRDYGVSNFDVDDMVEAWTLPGGDQIATNQALYNLARRGIEYDLVPWCRARGVPIMAYSPLEHASRRQRGMLARPALIAVAARHGATPAQVALAWLLQKGDAIAIPKAVQLDHIRETRGALDLQLTGQDLAELDIAFPPPRRRLPLATR
ncbi:MAG TPA: aldo/keto reductase [Gemmatimonadales bacterium]